MIMIRNYFSFTNFCVVVSFFDKFTNIRYFTFNSSRAVVVAKLVNLVILFLTSVILALTEVFILALTEALVDKLVILGVSF